jgi:exosome complex component RRP42
MARLTLSAAEEKYIRDGVACGVRADGRDISNYRPLQLETGIISNSNGSARLTAYKTDILVRAPPCCPCTKHTHYLLLLSP